MPSKQRKIAVMGYRSVGKSSLSIQFVEGQFVDCYDPTIENTFTKSTRVNSQDYDLKLVDTAGQDEYSIFPSQYSIDVHGYVLVYSITSAKSFEIIKTIYDKLLDITGKVQNTKRKQSIFSVPIVLVGNKTDLHMERMVSTDEGKKLADNWNAIFLEASAKQNTVNEDPQQFFERLRQEAEIEETVDEDEQPIKEEEFVLVKLATKKKQRHYVAKIIEIVEDGFNIKFYKKILGTTASRNLILSDESFINGADVVLRLPQPTSVGLSKRQEAQLIFPVDFSDYNII
ncbi:hypothetical protein FQA39_LY04466 [Lamprigera yunnana]|nr:hypothetical protein FQA39_LY04466 [Lamprigera yunnana]